VKERCPHNIVIKLFMFSFSLILTLQQK